MTPEAAEHPLEGDIELFLGRPELDVQLIFERER